MEPDTGNKNPFDELAAKYDEWFESPRGRGIFAMEAACLKGLMNGSSGKWLEVGVGTGRFAEVLGVLEGVDPSSSMLELAGKRGILTRQGRAEELPYPGGSFQGAIMVATLCFLDDPFKAISECARVLDNSGRLILGFVPLDSPWGELYQQRGKSGHPFYSGARFYTREQVLRMASQAGFKFDGAASCLFSEPEEPLDETVYQRGLIEGAGFAAVKFIVHPSK